MPRVTNADQVLLLLRERLARGERRERTGGSARIAATPTDARPLDRLRMLAAFDALDDDQRRRTVVHSLLLNEFGDDIANDAAFLGVLDEVLRIIGTMPGGTDLIDRAAAALNAP